MSTFSLAELLGRGWGPGWEEQEVVWRWREIVGEHLSKLARPLYVDRGVLHLAVASPLVAQELRLWSGELLARISQIAARSMVQEIRFVIVPEKPEPQQQVPEPSPKELNSAEELVPDNIPLGLRRKLVKLVAQVLAQEEAILCVGGRRCRRCGVAFLGAEKECLLCQLF